VEELKATFNSQVAQLKAQLSGREVEVNGLRAAVEETEARCAELSNILKDQNEKFEEEKRAWDEVKVELRELFEAEKAEKESISSLLVEKEIAVETLHGELGEKDTEVKNLKKRLRDTEDELERTREEVIRVKTEADTAAAATPVAPLSAPANFDEEAANKRTQEEVERVARELHNLYKTKHETKVAALKKSYESRWEKKVAALQQQVEALSRKNEELTKELEQKSAEQLRADVEFALGGDEAAEAVKAREEEAAKREEAAKAREEEAKKREEAAAKREEELMKRVAALEKQLDEEREERNGVIALADELLALQSSLTPPPPPLQEEERVVIEEKNVAAEEKSVPVPKKTVQEKKLAPPPSGLRSNIERMGMGAKKAQMRAAFLKTAAEKETLGKEELGSEVKSENEGEA
jgi:DNA repair exonuclease SbcCD ATPase subunit